MRSKFFVVVACNLFIYLIVIGQVLTSFFQFLDRERAKLETTLKVDIPKSIP